MTIISESENNAHSFINYCNTVHCGSVSVGYMAKRAYYLDNPKHAINAGERKLLQMWTAGEHGSSIM
jgi:hypothetical protein